MPSEAIAAPVEVVAPEGILEEARTPTTAREAQAAATIAAHREDNIKALQSMQQQSGHIDPDLIVRSYDDLLPKGLKDRYLAILGGDVLNLTEEAAILELRIQESLQLLDTGGFPRIWKQLYEMRNKLIATGTRLQSSQIEGFERKQLERRQAEFTKKLFDLIATGQQQALVWDEISLAIENKRRLVETERKRLASAGEYISQQEAVNMFMQYQSAVEANVHPDVFAQIWSTYEAQAGLASAH